MSDEFVTFVEGKGTPGVSRLNYEEFEKLMTAYLHAISNRHLDDEL